MTDPRTDEDRVVVEREFACRPALLWRALTQPHLIREWLMETDAAPGLGQRFRLVADWGDVACELREIEPERRLSYTWNTRDLRSVVTWTLTPTASGTRLRMEQVGFQPEQQAYFRGASAGWPRFLAALDAVVARLASNPSDETGETR